MRYRRMPIEEESPEQLGYGLIRRNLAESSVSDASLGRTSASTWAASSSSTATTSACRSCARRSPRTCRARRPTTCIVTPGAVAALFIIHTSLLEAGDHLVVARPNYATNVETPRAIGADVTYLDLAFDDGWAVDPARIAALMTPRTKLVSLTTPHNPTGTTLDEATLRDASSSSSSAGGARLLLDETYREMTFGEPLPVAASLSPSVISVSSLSKTYGLPGIRIGWLVTRDRALRDRFLAAKEQILISGSLVDETIALPRAPPAAGVAAADPGPHRRGVHDDGATGSTATDGSSGSRRAVGSSAFRASAPVSPWITDAFYRVLFEEHGTIVGPGHWFEQPRSYFRLGYGWPTLDELREGLDAIDAALEATPTG